MKGITAMAAAIVCMVRTHAKERADFQRAISDNREAGERARSAVAFLRDIEAAEKTLTARRGNDDSIV